MKKRKERESMVGRHTCGAAGETFCFFGFVARTVRGDGRPVVGETSVEELRVGGDSERAEKTERSSNAGKNRGEVRRATASKLRTRTGAMLCSSFSTFFCSFIITCFSFSLGFCLKISMADSISYEQKTVKEDC
jgi:hypothetical protein